MMRVAIVRCSYDLLPCLFRPQDGEVVSDLPADARVLEVWVEKGCRCVHITMESEAFEPVTEGRVIPWRDVTFRRTVNR